MKIANKLSLKNTMKVRVNAGIAFLNTVNPGWVKKIKLMKLDLADSNTCVLGEVYGSYANGLYEFNMYAAVDSIPEALRFCLLDDDDEEKYKMLTDIWKTAIKKLKK